MTSSDDLGRRLTAWLDERAAPTPPNGLDEAATERITDTRQLPAWATTERWIPMETRARFGAVPRAVILFVILAVLTAFTAAAIAIGSSAGTKLPPPFGVAGNGLVAIVQEGDLYVVEPDGSDRRLLVSSPDTITTPIWSRDGTRIAFISVPAEGGDPSLLVTDAKGTDPVVLATAAEADFEWIEWSADGLEIMYDAIVPELVGDGCIQVTDNGTRCGSRLFIVPVDGSAPPRQVGDPGLDARSPALSPDGITVAFGGGPAGSDALYLMDWDGTNVRELHGIADGTGGWAFAKQSWSADGAMIVTHDGGIGAQEIWLVPIDASEPTQISPAGGDQFWPRWSPDGSTIAWSGSVPTTLWTSEDGGTTRTLAVEFGDWSPDGLRFNGMFGLDLRSYDLDGEVVAELGRVDADGSSGSWQRIAADAG